MIPLISSTNFAELVALFPPRVIPAFAGMTRGKGIEGMQPIFNSSLKEVSV